MATLVYNIEYETRRPVLLRIAKEQGVEINAQDTITQIKEKLNMATAKLTKPVTTAKPAPVAAKPMPPKPAMTKPAPVAAPKPAAALAKPAAPKAAPAKPGPVAAAPKAAPAAPVKPAAPKAAEGPTLAQFEALKKSTEDFMASAQEVLDLQAKRMDALELAITGFDKFVTTDEAGNIVLDVENADAETLQKWAYQFSVCDHNAETESIRAAFIKARGAKNFQGWTVVNELPIPDEGAGEEAAEGEEEEEEITAEQIEKMPWADLAALADRIGLDYSAISKPQQPKVLRNQIREALAGMQGEETTEEAATEEAAEEGGLVEGETHVIVTHEGAEYPGTYMGQDADGDYIVQWDGGEEQVAVPADTISLG